MIIIGLTGGIGTGKSTASRLLSNLGAVVLDADSLGHDTYKKGTELFRALVKTFGQEIVGKKGEIDRTKLADIVFANQNLLTRLNLMVHPQIKTHIEKAISRLDRKKTSMVVIDAAILVEAGWTDLVDEVWVLTAERKTIIERLSNKFKNNMAGALKRMEFQMPQSELVSKADVVIDNDGSCGVLKERVSLLFKDRIYLSQGE
ncbi:MAG: dephospho-CoA kinase [Chloroflexota bacterium]|jgi:dephospho-CoA kinase|tara:strand:+ start:4217 stop:4825 length:609 start_codon:yes stop_codon:yes gene_type:complete